MEGMAVPDQAVLMEGMAVPDQAVLMEGMAVPDQADPMAEMAIAPVLVVMMMIGLVRKISTSVLLTIRSQFLLSKEKMTAWCRLIVRVS